VTRAIGHGQEREPVRAEPAPRRGGSDRVAETRLLGWQRSAGNQAVQRLLARHPLPVQRRRVPDTAHGDPLLAATATDSAAHVRGMERAVDRALSELSATDKQAVLNQAHTAAGGLAAYRHLTMRQRLQHLTTALRTLHPDVVLGDPALIDTGPRLGSADAGNLNTLVTNAAALIGIALSGARDNDLGDVFGTADIGTAKANYTAALNRMNFLHTNSRIVTDRSGYGGEVGLGGLTNPDQIALSPECIDNPTDNEHIVTLVHEAMHAGNGAITDHGYIGSTGFTALATNVKLTNAAHYEVVPRRVRGMANNYAGVVFVPAGTTAVVGGAAHTAPTLTPMQQACRQASETYREAWTLGLQVHSALVRVNLHPNEWNTLDLATTFGGASGHFADCLPFWSNVERLTIHGRPHLSATSGQPSEAPVTQADVALSEGLLRLLVFAMSEADQHLDTDAHAQTLLNRHASLAERNAATTVAARTDLLLKAIRRVVGELTGDDRRDVRAVKVMANAMAPGDYSRILVPRPPTSFA
jgi:hypothetical protein